MKKKLVAASIVLAALFFAGRACLRSIYVVPIATYHLIDVKSDESNRLLVVSPENFRRQMEFLKRYKYNIISLGELVDILNSKKRIPARTICVTFDDGYENNYKYAYPALKNLNIPATIFIMTDAIDKPGYLTTGEIQEMASGVISAGSHTKSHFWLGSDNNTARAKEEIFGSKEVLEKLTGKRVDFFCYPSGGFTAATRQLVIDAGYRGAMATNPGHNYQNSDPYALKRLRIARQCDNLLVFWFETSGYYTWLKERTHKRRHHKHDKADDKKNISG